MNTAQEVIDEDLDYICQSTASEFRRMAGRSLLIVGGAGFLGYYLIQSVLRWNRTGEGEPICITVFDNYIRGFPEWLTGLIGTSNLAVECHDIVQPVPMRVEGFDFIIHAASIASPTFYRQFPIETMDANVCGLRNILEYARREQKKGKTPEGILFYSTSEIYGDPTPDNIPTPESYRGNVSCTGPRACYDESKRYGETLCVTFAKQYALPIKVARPFNNYGPGLKITDQRVLPDFARDIFANRDIALLSDGSPTRTFCYITDAIIGYFKILIRGRPGEAYNIGIDRPEISMLDLAEAIATEARHLLGYTGRVVRKISSDVSYLVDNPNRRCPSILKARTELGFDPIITLDAGLRRSLLWYRENRGEESAA